MAEQQLHEVILFLMDKTSKQAKRHAQRVMDAKGMGLNVDQWVLLKAVENLENGSQRLIAEALTRDTASITRSLDLLEKKNLVARQRDPNSRRQHCIVLTQEGRQFISRYMPVVEALRSDAVKGLSQEEVQMLKKLMLRMQENFKA